MQTQTNQFRSDLRRVLVGWKLVQLPADLMQAFLERVKWQDAESAFRWVTQGELEWFLFCDRRPEADKGREPFVQLLWRSRQPPGETSVAPPKRTPNWPASASRCWPCVLTE